MATIGKFTEPFASSASKGDAVQAMYWESRTPGFGLRVGATRKAWVVQRDINGKAIQTTLGTYPQMKVEEARRVAKAELAKMAGGIDPRPARRRKRAVASMTLADALALYASDAARDPRTVADFKYVINKYLHDWLDRSLLELGSDDGRAEVNARHQQIIADIRAGLHAHKDRRGNPRPQHGRTGTTTADHTMIAFRTIWNRAMRQSSALPVCPTINVTFTPYKPKRNRLEYDQLRPWWEAIGRCQSAERRDFLRVALLTGLRSNDIKTMAWKDVDLKQATLHVPAPKGGEAFDLPISRRLLALLKQRKSEHEIALKKKLLPEHAAPWCFGAWSESGHIVEPYEDVPGIEYTPHALRHTYRQIAEVKAGVSEARVGTLMNHRQARATVTQIYGRVEVDDLRQPAQQIEDAIAALIETNVVPMKRKAKA